MSAIIERVNHLQCPNWVKDILDNTPSQVIINDGALQLSIRKTSNYLFIEGIARDAALLNSIDFQQSVTRLYTHCSRILLDHPNFYPIRWWNDVPLIRQFAPDGRDWYMVFNAGRSNAYDAHPNLRHNNKPLTASAVSVRGENLVIHLLAGLHQGTSIENPRQIPASDYSDAYGPIPPHFARATCAPTQNHNTMVMIAGTASVVGEDSVHIGNLDKQIDETFLNIAIVIANAHATSNHLPNVTELSTDKIDHWLKYATDVRAYVVNEHDVQTVEHAIQQHFGNLKMLEIVHADLCRDDLLVEIEAVACI